MAQTAAGVAKRGHALGRALDDALALTFPARDPVALTIDSGLPKQPDPQTTATHRQSAGAKP